MYSEPHPYSFHESVVDSPDSPAWTIQVTRTDGERACLRLFDDGSGGLAVAIGGSAGADVDVIEDRRSLAPMAFHLRWLSPADADWNDRKRRTEALGASGADWQTSNPGPNIFVHDCLDGTEIVAEHAEFTGRLVYATIRQPSEDDPRRILGAEKLDRVLAAIAESSRTEENSTASNPQ
jgi:hypothetical protein